MNFSSLIGLAKQANREKTNQPVKGFSTVITPLKKPVRNNVPSASVRAFLEKREQEQKDKVVQAMRDKEKLLALRAQNSKSNKAAKLMASRTKDNDFSRIRLTEDEVETRDKVEAQLRRQVICDKVERMKARIKLEEHEAQQPHKRKRKSKSQNNEMELSPSPPPPPMPPPTDHTSRPNGAKKPRPAPAPAMSFSDLMKMASVKQYEDPEDDLPEKESKTGRPLTKAEKLEEEYKQYRMNGGTGGRTEFELAYFKMQAKVNDGLRQARKRIPRKQPPQESKPVTVVKGEQRAPERTSTNRMSTSESVQRQNDNRNSYRTDERDAYRSAESKGIQRTSENKSVQRLSDSKSAHRVSESKNMQRANESKNIQRSSDNVNSKRSSDSVNQKRSSDSINSHREGKSSQQSGDNRNSRYDDNRSSQRPSDSSNVQRTSGSKVQHRSSDNVERRMQNTKEHYRTQEKINREQTPKVPSYSTVKKPSVKPEKSYKTDISYSESQFKSPPPKHESAFLNSLPNKKPRLGLPTKEQARPAMVSKYDAEIEKQRTSSSKLNPKQSNSKEKLGSEQNRKHQFDLSKVKKEPTDRINNQFDPSIKVKKEPSDRIYKSKEVSYKPTPIKKLEEQRRHTKVSLNDNWLEDDDNDVPDSRMMIVPKKKLPPSNVSNERISSSAPQKTPLESEMRRERPQGQKSSSNSQPVRKSSSNSNGQFNNNKYKQQDPVSKRNSDCETYRPPEKKMKRSIDDNDRLDDRSYNRPVSKKSSGSSQSEVSVKKNEGPPSPTGSRRNLDTLWPMRSMARNPCQKLPPIRSSKGCSYIKSDSEDDYEEEEDWDDYDDDMADFIDDGPLSESEDVSRHIREIFGYDKRRYRNERYDDEAMESTFVQQMKEEARSLRIGRLEDLEEERKEMERKMVSVGGQKKKR